MFNPFRAVYNYLAHCYLLYELNTSIYMLDYPSKVAMNTLFLTIVSLITYSTYVYLPSYVFTILAFFNLTQPAAAAPAVGAANVVMDPPT